MLDKVNGPMAPSLQRLAHRISDPPGPRMLTFPKSQGANGPQLAAIIENELAKNAVARPTSVGYVDFETVMNKAFADIRNGSDGGINTHGANASHARDGSHGSDGAVNADASHAQRTDGIWIPGFPGCTSSSTS